MIQEERGDFQNKKKSCVIREQGYTRSIYRHFEKSLRDLVTKGKLAGDVGGINITLCVWPVVDTLLLYTEPIGLIHS